MGFDFATGRIAACAGPGRKGIIMPIEPVTPSYGSVWNGWSARKSVPTLRQIQTDVRTDLDHLGRSVRDDFENNKPTIGKVIDVLV